MTMISYITYRSKVDDSRQEPKGSGRRIPSEQCHKWFRSNHTCIHITDHFISYYIIINTTYIDWNSPFYSVVLKLSKTPRCSFLPVRGAVCHVFNFLFYEWPLYLRPVFIEFLTFSQILRMRSKIANLCFCEMERVTLHMPETLIVP